MLTPMTPQQASQAVYDRAIALATHLVRCRNLAQNPYANRTLAQKMAADAEREIQYEAKLAELYAKHPRVTQPYACGVAA
ncbi:MAG: hypothetical protein KAY02_01400 [Acidovorax sp.]|nr:hypothetical protein [Acidovorax sp.]